MSKKKKKTLDNYKIDSKKAWELSKSWKNAAITWRTLDHIFACGSFAASIAVVFISSINWDAKLLVILLSSLAAILTMISFACNPTRYMSNYRVAFDTLNDSLLANTDSQGELKSEESRKQIARAITMGEKFIGRTFEVDDIPMHGSDAFTRLSELQTLKDSNIITEEEYQDKRKQIINEI